MATAQSLQALQNMRVLCVANQEELNVVLEADNKVEEAELPDDSDICFRLRMQAKSWLWEMVVKFIDKKRNRLGYRDDPKLQLAKEYLRSVFSTEDVRDEAMHAVLHKALMDFDATLQPLMGEIERRETDAVLTALCEHPIMQKIGLEEKKEDMVSLAHTMMWAWIDKWALLSKRYAVLQAFPAEMFRAVRSVAMEAAQKGEVHQNVPTRGFQLALQVMARTPASVKESFLKDDAKIWQVLQDILDLVYMEMENNSASGLPSMMASMGLDVKGSSS